MKKEIYRVLIIGPTGSGKSQFCNFIQRDSTNSINEVGNDLDSCTKAPKSNIFSRKGLNMTLLILQEVQIHQIMMKKILEN